MENEGEGQRGMENEGEGQRGMENEGEGQRDWRMRARDRGSGE